MLDRQQRRYAGLGQTPTNPDKTNQPRVDYFEPNVQLSAKPRDIVILPNANLAPTIRPFATVHALG